MHHDFHLHYLERIAEATEAQAETVAKTRRDVKAVRAQVQEMLGWVRRIALALALWGTAGGVALSSDQIAEVAVVVIERMIRR